MREGQFIKQNIERWKSYEEPTDDPDEVAKRFTYLVDDLAYAKTFYPFSNTVKFINGLALRIYLSIYRNKKESRGRFKSFFVQELPLVIRRHHRTLLFTFLFFTAFMLIGIFSAWQDQSFARGVLGDGYVDMTERNIAQGDPFGVYKDENELVMFLYIAFNNIKVAFMCFAFGLLFSVGTIWILFRNGLMLGVFEQMFFHHGLGVQSILVVFIHGTLEISAIVIAGSAGLMIGNAMLFPKTYKRGQAFKMAAKDSIKIMVCLVPIFLVAAFFEGFVTRHTGMPLWMSILILASSLAFILWYFVFYPIKVSKRVRAAQDE
jgi:uncharacterized membrane protein SpoIIM required for sporulation